MNSLIENARKVANSRMDARNQALELLESMKNDASTRTQFERLAGAVLFLIIALDEQSKACWERA